MHRKNLKENLLPSSQEEGYYLFTPYYRMKNGKCWGICASLSKTGLCQFQQKVVFSLQSELKFLCPCCTVPGPNNSGFCDLGEVEPTPLKQGPVYSWKVWDSWAELCNLQFPSNLNFMRCVLLCFPVIFMQGKAKFCPFLLISKFHYLQFP